MKCIWRTGCPNETACLTEEVCMGLREPHEHRWFSIKLVNTPRNEDPQLCDCGAQRTIITKPECARCDGRGVTPNGWTCPDCGGSAVEHEASKS
jgi:hypothetical protein